MTDDELDALAAEVRRTYGDRFPVPTRDEAATDRELREEITRHVLETVVLTDLAEQRIADGAARCHMTGLRVDGVSVELDSTLIVDGITVDISPGAFVGLLGPNGSGKTTLLRTLHRTLRPVRGTVMIGGDDVWSLSARHAAQRVAVVSQDTRIGFDNTVLGGSRGIGHGTSAHSGRSELNANRHIRPAARARARQSTICI